MNYFLFSEKLVRAIDSRQAARKLSYALVYGLNVAELDEFLRLLKSHRNRWRKLQKINPDQGQVYCVLVYRCDNLLDAITEVRQEK